MDENFLIKLIEDIRKHHAGGYPDPIHDKCVDRLSKIVWDLAEKIGVENLSPAFYRLMRK